MSGTSSTVTPPYQTSSGATKTVGPTMQGSRQPVATTFTSTRPS